MLFGLSLFSYFPSVNSHGSLYGSLPTIVKHLPDFYLKTKTTLDVREPSDGGGIEHLIWNFQKYFTVLEKVLLFTGN